MRFSTVQPLLGVAVVTWALARCTSSPSPEGRSTAEPAASHAAPAPTNDVKPEEPKLLRFAYRPRGATAREYEMSAPEEQHQIWMAPGVRPGTPPSLIAFHGQPRRGKSPADYESPRVILNVVREAVQARVIEPLVVLIPVFRFEGKNWPNFDVAEFLAEANRHLREEGIELREPYVIGHSGAAGCGGGALNALEGLNPRAVGFFDTCLGGGFRQSVQSLARRKIPTLIMHSVETAGFHPREPIEYNDHFDYGLVYGPLGLKPAPCPEVMPEVPLRKLDYRCASNSSGTTEALVVDTGTGEPAHNDTLPVGLRYFFKRYLHAATQR